MIIESVDLTNFRSHSTYHLDCNPDTTLILGPNGCGKTSVLEAIYILTRGKSFRATDPEILKRDADFYRIEFKSSDGQKFIATFDGSVKTFTIADKKSRRLPRKSQYPVIFFEPADLNLITGSPSRHRDYFDRIFAQLSPDYASNLNKYNKTRDQRNKLLKSDFCTDSNLFSWNLLLAKLGVALSQSRADFIQKINQSLDSVYHSIAENSDHVELNYISEVTSLTESQYLEKLEQNKLKDLALGYTTFGVHRDDYEFIFNHQNANGSASRGESRSIILALKFVEANLIEKILNTKPIVLLDDVFSELDDTRRKCLVKNFKDNQVIITSVEAIS